MSTASKNTAKVRASCAYGLIVSVLALAGVIYIVSLVDTSEVSWVDVVVLWVLSCGLPASILVMLALVVADRIRWTNHIPD